MHQNNFSKSKQKRKIHSDIILAPYNYVDNVVKADKENTVQGHTEIKISLERRTQKDRRRLLNQGEPAILQRWSCQ